MRTIDWTDQTQVLNEFVDAVHAGDTDRVVKAGEQLVSGCFGGEFETPDEVGAGVVLSEALLPYHPDTDPSCVPGVELLDGLVPAQRFDAILQGDALRMAELTLWRQVATEDILASTDLDWDVFSMWSVWRLEHTDGRHAFLAKMCGGYSFTEPWSDYKGAGKTIDEALEALKSAGFISVQDFRARRTFNEVSKCPEGMKAT